MCDILERGRRSLFRNVTVDDGAPQRIVTDNGHELAAVRCRGALQSVADAVGRGDRLRAVCRRG